MKEIRGITRLDDFLKLKEECAVKYDFSMEKAPEAYCKATSTERYIIYKAYTIYGNYGNKKEFEKGRQFVQDIHDNYTAVIDPDNKSELLQAIYRKVWPDLYQGVVGKLYSDTMTSVQYTINGYFEDCIECLAEKEYRKHELSKPDSLQKCTIRYMITLWAAESGSNLEERIRKSASRLEKIPEIANFFEMWHTLGNYCPVPHGFNGSRSYYGEYDFWDLTLMKIKDWYCSAYSKSEYDRQNLLRNDLFHNNASADVLSCINWLNQFGTGMVGWRHFINYFYLQNWVDKDYEVIPLWENHSWNKDGTSLPKDNMKEFFLEYEKRIRIRSETIFNVLKSSCNAS